ncbi:uncharacterized protein RCO7_04870 [Rhynchosporium graminicola]|uniref:Uncharacterized protein n=1 Tax=Rhynchosporium graminicola TaxID=2792576 RepID=A0A1E1KEM2_9HELO|nr:uncharacterized protein RCO7_04870 [Rhynchosporium commune]
MVPDTISTPLDPSRYSWQQSSQDPSLWQRLALSGECMWTSSSKDVRELFITSTLTLTLPISRTTLDSAAAHAWQTLRLQLPQLALRISVAPEGAEAGIVYLQYRTPQSQAEVDAWIDRTSHYGAGRDVLSLEDLRVKVLLEKQGHDSDQAFMLLHSQALDYSHDLVENFQIMLNVDHQVTDGNGTKIILGKYLSLLASALDTSNETLQEEISWEESHKNLIEPWIQHMNKDQVTDGTEYQCMVAQNQTYFLVKSVHATVLI